MKEEFAEVISNFDLFDFEERKNIQQFISELYSNFAETFETTLEYNKHEVVNTLIDSYTKAGMSPFVGNLLRLYTKSKVCFDV